MSSERIQPVLPVAPRPYPDELFSSWVSRVACRYGCTALDLLTCLDQDVHSTPRNWCPLDFEPKGSVIAALAAACRMSPDVVRGLTLSKVFADRPRHWLTWKAPAPPPDGGERSDFHIWGQISPSYCPACLYDDAAAGRDGYIRRDWAVAYRSHCAKHHSRLWDYCFNCKRHIHVFQHNFGNVAHLSCADCRSSLALVESPPRVLVQHEASRQADEVGRFVVEFENTLDDALNGRVPDPRWFGPAEPASFVRALEDLVRIMWGGWEHPSDTAGRHADCRPVANFEVLALRREFRGTGGAPMAAPLAFVRPAMRYALVAAVLRLLRLPDCPIKRLPEFQFDISFDWLHGRTDIQAYRSILETGVGWPPALAAKASAEIAAKKAAAESAARAAKPTVVKEPARAPEKDPAPPFVSKLSIPRLKKATDEFFSPEKLQPLAQLPERERKRRIGLLARQILERYATMDDE